MLRRARIPVSSCGNIFGPYSSDQGVFIDLRAPKQTGIVDAHGNPCKGYRSQIREISGLRSDGCSNGQPGNLPWPQLSSATAIPTPYQIFHLEKDAIYSKRHFYELVKVYHPDRYIPEQNLLDQRPLSSAVRNERYRLVVAANDILSDPVKRSAYDRYGSGWERHEGFKSSKYSPHYRYHPKWSGFDTYDSPMRNATWEDWERWYQRHNRQKQEPVYFSNGTFLSLVVILAAVAGTRQAKLMGDSSLASLEQFEAMTKECNKIIQGRRSASREFDNKYDRLQRFLDSRAPHGNDMLQPTDDIHTNLLPPPESWTANENKE
jgi:hypothetical protein